MRKPSQIFIASVVAGFTLVCLSAAAAAQEQNDWSGFYLGANVGLHDVETSGVFDAAELGVTPDLEGIGGEGVNLGIQGGYNYQIGQIFVGVEGDLSFGGFEESIVTIQDGSADEAGLLSYPIQGDLTYLATIRGRVGFSMEEVFHHAVLVFVTGGVAFTEFNMDIANGRSDVGFKDTGLTWGGGIEMPVSPRMLLRADYLHVKFDERLNISGVATSGVFDANDGNTVKLKNVDMIRFGLDIMMGGL
jgi:opacity protein-like surface antigen